MIDPLLSAHSIHKDFGSGAILANVSLHLYRGSITLLTGRNGSGKTTLVNCLTGFDLRYRGEVYLNGAPLRRRPAEHRARLGIVRTFQYPHLFAELTVGQHLALGALASTYTMSSYLKSIDARLAQSTSAVRLGMESLLNKRGRQLSFGEMKLVNTARLIETGGSVIILDEPLASIHGARRQAVLHEIVELRKSGCALLVIEHLLPELQAIADTVCEIEDGVLTTLI